MGYEFLFAVALFLIIFALFTLLPDVQRCELTRPTNPGVSAAEAGVLLLLCAVYGFMAFYKLGSTDSPTTFIEFSPSSEIIVELNGEETVAEMRLFSGINVGSVLIEFSEDGENYAPAAEFEQDYVAVLKWNSVSPDISAMSAPTRFVRFRWSGGKPRIGEAAFLTASGERIVPVTACALTDEPDFVRFESDYMYESYFDEIYHARTAVEFIDSIKPYEVTHPPLGKVFISLGIRLFGLNPFGWRFSGTLFGVLMLPCLYFFCRRLFERRIALCCTVIFAFDFMHFTQTRIATIDTYGVFFIILMYWMMYEYLCEGETRRGLSCLAFSGLSFGFGAASKWTCFYAGAGLALIWLWHWCSSLWRCDREERGIVLRSFINNALFCIVFFVMLPALIYYLSYVPYGRAEGMSGIGMLFRRDYLKLVLDNQSYMFNYHASVSSFHPFSSRWHYWIFDVRPILYFMEESADGTRRSISAFVNPALCWGGLISFVPLGYLAIARRDRRSAFILVGYLAQLVPWMFISRTTFEYHYFPSTIFLTLALGTVFELLFTSERRWRIPVYGYTALCVGLFVLFYPALSGTGANAAFVDKALNWLPTWPL